MKTKEFHYFDSRLVGNMYVRFNKEIHPEFWSTIAQMEKLDILEIKSDMTKIPQIPLGALSKLRKLSISIRNMGYVEEFLLSSLDGTILTELHVQCYINMWDNPNNMFIPLRIQSILRFQQLRWLKCAV